MRDTAILYSLVHHQSPFAKNPEGTTHKESWSPRQQRMQISKMERSRLKPDAGIQKLDEERRVKQVEELFKTGT